ncbi:MAG: phosphate acyltransferase PlsX [Bacillota bacterium]
MRIAVDGMGGDHAPLEIIKGCIDALNESDIEIVLVGLASNLEEILKDFTYDRSRLHIKNASEIIMNTDQPIKAVRQKKDSSMVVGLDLVKNKEVDAFVSAGNTGALLTGSLLRIGRIKGIDRPAIATVYPTKKGISLLIDAGANTICKPQNLMDFALMGSIYAEKVMGIDNPLIGLINVGTEEIKGNELMKESYEQLSSSSLNFHGNVEAREIPNGIVDVIVCDGFVGNVILKLTEGVAMTLMSMLKDLFGKTILSKIGAALLLPALKEFKRNLDYTEYGGAPLLGINGTVIKAHGSSNANAIRNAIKQGKVIVEKEVVQIINKEISKIGDEEIHE